MQPTEIQRIPLKGILEVSEATNGAGWIGLMTYHRLNNGDLFSRLTVTQVKKSVGLIFPTAFTASLPTRTLCEILAGDESILNLATVEGTPPVILDKKGRDKSSEKYSGAYIKTKVKVDTDLSFSGVAIRGKIIVIFTVVDNAGLDKAVIYVQTGGERAIYLGGVKRAEIEEEFEIGDVLRLIHGGFDVKVNATDLGGNWATGKTHIDSALQTLKKGLSALLDMIVAALKVIAKVASMLIDVIKKIISTMLSPITTSIKKTFKEWSSGIYYAIDRIVVIGDIDEIDVNLLLDTIFAGYFVLFINLIALIIVDVLEPIILALEIVSGGGAIADAILSTILLTKASSFLRSLYISIYFSTLLTLFGEVLSAVIPHDDPGLGMCSAVGTLLVSLVAIALSRYIQKVTGLSKGDVCGLFLALLGFFLSMSGAAYPKYAHLMSVLGAGVAGVGLVIALLSPDIPGIIGWLDEGVDAVLFGWAVYDAIGE